MKKAAGNMYDWVTHVHNALGGKCPHGCSYCYVDGMGYPAVRQRYTGPIRLIEAELKANLGKGNRIFVCHLNDLFADGVRVGLILPILEQCHRFPENEYYFQSKNPDRMRLFRDRLPPHRVLGTTIETNRYEWAMGNAPAPWERAKAIMALRLAGEKTFITIEPIMEFDLEEFAQMLSDAWPGWVNIGADSQGHNLPEPEPGKVRELMERLRGAGIEVREKPNLKRILQEVLADGHR